MSEREIFTLPPLKITVREYECDLQGILNNSVYLNYYEYARSFSLSANNLSLGKLLKQGILLVVSRVNICYLRPLHPKQTCCIYTSVSAQGLVRLIFHQQLYNGETFCNEATTTVVAISQGKPQPVTPFLELFRTTLPCEYVSD